MHNAMYGQKNLFGHMVAMRGKHGHAEGASHAEDADRSGKPFPSGRWTLGRIRSIPEDAMLAGCSQMIWRSVKRLRRHGLLRGSVYIAMDFYNVCRCDKGPDMKFMRYSKHKNGAHLCNMLASVHCVTEDSRACLGVLVRTRKTFPVDAVAALLDMCESNGIQIRTLLLDREFYSAEIMNLLEWRGINWLMPAVKTDTVKRAVSEFGVGRRGGRLRLFGRLQTARPVHPDDTAGRGRE